MNLRLERKSPDLIEIYNGTTFIGEFIMDVDGFYMYFSTSIDGSRCVGGMSEYFLEIILAQLKKINDPWRKNIEDFFKTQKPVEIQETFEF
jgi:hypothetical protein